MRKLILWTCALFFFFSGFSQGKLPVIILPATPHPNMPLVFIFTGDGGWKGFDQRLAHQFVEKGAPVVALNSLRYFWDRKTPDQATAAVAGLLKYYMRLWNKNRFILVGFSFGAEILPFIVNRLSPALSNKDHTLVFLSPGPSNDFDIHLSQMMDENRSWKYQVPPEISRIHGKNLLFFFGDSEKIYPVKTLPKHHCRVIYLKGGHHYEGNPVDISKIILGI
ncbi:MAG: AcvB/VirJ family lysyl-phosphatidylglycerol hydrolase [Chitinophagaceae bacterium]